jgi:hypothetical protein
VNQIDGICEQWNNWNDGDSLQQAPGHVRVLHL